MTRTMTPAALTAALMVVAPAALLAAPTPASATDTVACTVTVADVLWEAGSSELIASGAVSTDDEAISFTDGSGVVDPVGPVGSIAFEGALSFASDAGVKTTLSGGTVVLAEDSGQLLFDVDAEGSSSAAQAPLATIDLRGAAVTEDGETVTVTAVEAPTSFADDAITGWVGEPGALDLTVVAECPAPEATGAPDSETTGAAPGAADDADGQGLWIGLGVGALALVVAVLLAAGSIARRRRDAASADQPTHSTGPTDLPEPDQHHP